MIGSYGSSSGTNLFWDTERSEQETGGFPGSSGKTTVQMKQQNTFTGWNFNDTWNINEENTYPYFRNYNYDGNLPQ